jgi:hypothetical protein
MKFSTAGLETRCFRVNLLEPYKIPQEYDTKIGRKHFMETHAMEMRRKWKK